MEVGLPVCMPQVKRYMQKFIETEIGKMIIRGDASEGKNIYIDYLNDELKIRVE